MEELRAKVAAKLEVSTNRGWLEVADAILALPEIRDALELAARKGQAA